MAALRMPLLACPSRRTSTARGQGRGDGMIGEIGMIFLTAAASGHRIVPERSHHVQLAVQSDDGRILV